MGLESISNLNASRRVGRAGLAIKALLTAGPVSAVADLLTAVRYVVRGDSMQPSLARDEYIVVSQLAYWLRDPRRGEVIVLRNPRQQPRSYIKRIVGLPGEHVRTEAGRVLINGELLDEPYLQRVEIHNGNKGSSTSALVTSAEAPGRFAGAVTEWFLDDGQYFVMGDNRANSDDGRSFGPLARELIVGKAWVRYWPRGAWGRVR